MGMTHKIGWAGFAALAMLGFAVHAAELPVADFVRNPPLQDPVISPDGHDLAVVVPESGDNTDARAAIGILRLPGLSPLSRLDMTPMLRPMQIVWVSNHRLVIALAQDSGTLEGPQLITRIIAVNDDGSGKRILYSLRDSVYASGHVENATLLNFSQGVPTIVGASPSLDGHLFLSVTQMPAGSIAGLWGNGDSYLYDVYTGTGHATQIGAIAHAGMVLLPAGGVARIAVGQDPNMQAAVFTSTNGKDWKRLPDTIVGKVFDPLQVSTDGKHVYALSSTDGGPNQLIQMGLDGSNREVLASDPFSSASGVMWNPVTGVPVAAIFEAGGAPLVKFVGTGKYARIMHSLAAEHPGQVVQLLDGSSDGSVLLLDTQSDRDPGVVALYDLADGQTTPLYRILPSIDPQAMPRRTLVRFRDRAGVELQGFLTVPNGIPLKNLPLVLMPHGGPIGVSDSWFFDPWAALLADRGYAVLQINYRGSGGRGVFFRDSGFRQFGTGIQQDLIDGVEWTIAQGYADPKRICVFGGSFGGYSALMQPILAPKLYKCAIDYAGVYDWRLVMQKGDASDDAYGQRYFAQALGSIRDAYAISPASMLGKFDVPVLIAHGEDDPRVPFQNAVDLRSALQAAGKPYEWLAEPHELHGFVSDRNNEQLFTMITNFLAKYIGPGAIVGGNATAK